jgi:hypothetical protein
MSGIFEAVVVMCLVGHPATYENCVFERAINIFESKEACETMLYKRAETLHIDYDINKLYIVIFECHNWLYKDTDSKI